MSGCCLRGSLILQYISYADQDTVKDTIDYNARVCWQNTELIHGLTRMKDY